MSNADFVWGSTGRKYRDPSEYDVQTVVGPATTIVVLGDGTFSPTKAIIGDQPGTATIVDAKGNTITGFPITGTEQNISITAISNFSGTTTVWGLY